MSRHPHVTQPILDIDFRCYRNSSDRKQFVMGHTPRFKPQCFAYYLSLLSPTGQGLSSGKDPFSCVKNWLRTWST